MIHTRPFAFPLSCLLALALASPIAAQSPTSSSSKSKPKTAAGKAAKPAKSGAKARTPTQEAAALVAAGKAAEGLEAIQKVLAASPASRDAAIVKIDALIALDRTPDAVDAYRAFAAAAKKAQDPDLARHLARAALRREAVGTHPDAAPIAARLLREAGESAPAAPPQTLSAGAAPPGGSGAPAASPESIVASASAQPATKGEALDRLMPPVETRTRQAVRDLLKAEDPRLKMSAIDAARRLDIRDAVPELRLLLSDELLPVKLRAAAALHQFGDNGGDAVLRDALKSEFLAGRLLAARALHGSGDKTWPAAIAPLLDSPRGNERVAAAEILLDTEYREKARLVLQKDAASEDPVVRSDAIRLVAAHATDTWAYLPQMKDSNAVVRVYAAGVVLRTLGKAPAHAAAARR